MKYCINCENKLKENEDICSKCGTKTGLLNKEKIAKKKEDNKQFLIAVAIIVPICIIASLLYFFLTKNNISNNNNNQSNNPNEIITEDPSSDSENDTEYNSLVDKLFTEGNYKYHLYGSIKNEKDSGISFYKNVNNKAEYMLTYKCKNKSCGVTTRSGFDSLNYESPIFLIYDNDEFIYNAESNSKSNNYFSIWFVNAEKNYFVACDEASFNDQSNKNSCELLDDKFNIISSYYHIGSYGLATDNALFGYNDKYIKINEKKDSLYGVMELETGKISKESSYKYIEFFDNKILVKENEMSYILDENFDKISEGYTFIKPIAICDIRGVICSYDYYAVIKDHKLYILDKDFNVISDGVDEAISEYDYEACCGVASGLEVSYDGNNLIINMPGGYVPEGVTAVKYTFDLNTRTFTKN